MAVLSADERKAIAAEFMRNPGGVFGKLTKQDIFAAVDAVDLFLDGGGTLESTKGAIPVKAAALTDPQIATLAKLIDLKRNPPPAPEPVPDSRVADVALVLADMGFKEQANEFAERLLKALGSNG